jgi:hypothetical protein
MLYSLRHYFAELLDKARKRDHEEHEANKAELSDTASS